MGRKNKQYDDDDGRTIADMSGIYPSDSTGFPNADKDSGFSQQKRRRDFSEPEPAKKNDRPWEKEAEYTSKEKMLLVLGGLKAALMIGLVYVAVFGVLIWLMTKLW